MQIYLPFKDAAAPTFITSSFVPARNNASDGSLTTISDIFFLISHKIYIVAQKKL